MIVSEFYKTPFTPKETTFQSSSDLARILFTIKVLDNIHGISLIGIKRSPAELFYHSTWPKDAKRDLQNTKNGEMTKRPDHFSYHTDGNAHMRTTKKGILGNTWNFPDHSFLPKDPSSITPLLIHSIKVNNDKYSLPLLDEISKSSYHLVEQVAVIEKPQSFSISLFLVPANISTDDILSGMWVDYHLQNHPPVRLNLRHLCNNDFSSGRFNIEGWSDCDVLFVLSDLIMPVPPDIEPRDYFKIITIVNSPMCFEKMLAQRIGRVEFVKKSDQDF